MKKTYIAPNMVVVKLNTKQKMLAGSLGSTDTPYVNFNQVNDGYSEDDAE